MGIVSEILTVHGRKPIFGYKAMVTSICAIAFLSFLVWGHHMFTSGMNPLVGTAFMVTTLAIAIPSAVKTFNWVATLWRARIHFTPAMLFAIGFVSLFVTGGLTGIFLGSPAVDIYFQDTFFVVAHFHFVMASASLFGVFGGLYHWFPKMFGRMMDERLGKLHFWLTFVGIYATFFPMHFLGMAGEPRRYYSPQMYDFLRGLSGLNMFVSLAAFGLGLAQLIFAYNFIRSLFRGPKAEGNPWHANTLEWQGGPPPPPGDWGGTPPPGHPRPAAPSRPGAPAGQIPPTAARPAGGGAGGARRHARRGEMAGLRTWLTVTTLLGLAFLAGQLLAWRQLVAAGVYLSSYSHSSFFYLLTGAHGLHLAGGIGALLYAVRRAAAAATAGAALDVGLPAGAYLILPAICVVSLFCETFSLP